MPEANDKDAVYIDKVNSKESINKVNIAPGDALTTISGRAYAGADKQNGSALYLCVNGKYYEAQYPGTMKDQRSPLNKLVNFTITLKSSDLKQAQNISFVLVSKDRKLQYAPVSFKVVNTD